MITITKEQAKVMIELLEYIEAISESCPDEMLLLVDLKEKMDELYRNI